MKHKAIIFDLDGTLLDTLQDLTSSMNAVLASFGFPIHNKEKYKIFVGDGVETLIRRALPNDKKNSSVIHECLTAIKKEYNKRWDETTKPYPGIEEMLNGLSEKNIRISILSNKPHDFTKLTVSKLLSKWKFEYVYGARDNVNVKPDPSGALEIAKNMKLMPEEFLYLGDTNTDMKTAKAAGMLPVGVLWGFRGEEELRSSGAKVIIQKPDEIFSFL